MYVLLIRPQQKRVRAQQALVSRHSRSATRSMTSAGIYGIVTELDDDTFLIEVAEGIEMRMAAAPSPRILTKGADRLGRALDRRRAPRA